MITVDTHQHFWEINRFDYDWMPKNYTLKEDKITTTIKSNPKSKKKKIT